MESNKRRVISLLVDNQSGVLARVSSLFCRRGFNIDSLTVSATNDPTVSRITVTVSEISITMFMLCSIKTTVCSSRRLLIKRFMSSRSSMPRAAGRRRRSTSMCPARRTCSTSATIRTRAVAAALATVHKGRCRTTDMLGSPRS